MLITRDLIPALARGCAVLGTGGGGEVYTGTLIAQQAIDDFGPVELVTLDDLPDDGIVLPIGEIGAPTIGLEKYPNGAAGAILLAEVEAKMGRPVVALMPSEIGGSNGLLPFSWAANLGLPVVDADSMGRAFPEVPMVSPHVLGYRPELLALSDEHGNVVIINAVSGNWAEQLARSLSVVFGGTATMVDYPLPVSEARKAYLVGSVRLALRIGQALENAEDPLGSVTREVGATRLITGKVADVERRVSGGFVRGSALIEGVGTDLGRLLRLEIQNENLAAFEDGHALASVPDLITVLDEQTGEAVATEVLRYGQRVAVLAFPCHPLWRTPAGLKTVGPRAFGYDFDYTPLEATHVAR